MLPLLIFGWKVWSTSPVEASSLTSFLAVTPLTVVKSPPT